MAELRRDVSKRAFVRDMQRYVPGVRAMTSRSGRTGSRGTAPDGDLVDDFLIVGHRAMMHVLNLGRIGAAPRARAPRRDHLVFVLIVIVRVAPDVTNQRSRP